MHCPCAVCSPPVHTHAASMEFLTVRNGELGYSVNGTEHVAKAGDGSVPHRARGAARLLECGADFAGF